MKQKTAEIGFAYVQFYENKNTSRQKLKNTMPGPVKSTCHTLIANIQKIQTSKIVKNQLKKLANMSSFDQFIGLLKTVISIPEDHILMQLRPETTVES